MCSTLFNNAVLRNNTTDTWSDSGIHSIHREYESELEMNRFTYPTNVNKIDKVEKVKFKYFG